MHVCMQINQDGMSTSAFQLRQQVEAEQRPRIWEGLQLLMAGVPVYPGYSSGNTGSAPAGHPGS
jgi:hypothetical protein